MFISYIVFSIEMQHIKQPPRKIPNRLFHPDRLNQPPVRTDLTSLHGGIKGSGGELIPSTTAKSHTTIITIVSPTLHHERR